MNSFLFVKIGQLEWVQNAYMKSLRYRFKYNKNLKNGPIFTNKKLFFVIFLTEAKNRMEKLEKSRKIKVKK